MFSIVGRAEISKYFSSCSIRNISLYSSSDIGKSLSVLKLKFTAEFFCEYFICF